MTPTAAQLKSWSREQQDSIKSQLAYIESKTAREGSRAGRAMSAEAIKKRKEREDKRRKAATERAAKDAAEAHEADVEDEDGDGDEVDGDAEPNTNMISSGSTVTPSKASASKYKSKDTSHFLPPSSPSPSSATATNGNLPYTISIPASSSSLEWYNSHQRSQTTVYTTLHEAREAGKWVYPSTLAERARCGVFKDLWKQGYFLGGGIKFGGEYLVYPGGFFFPSPVSLIHESTPPLFFY